MNNGGGSQINGPQEAVNTYIEQTKLLVSLASAFILAPAAALPFIGNTATIPSHAKFLFLVWGEVLFVLSILAGYFVLGTIAGSQHLNKFDVYRAGTKWFSRIQIGFYVLGLVFFLIFLLGVIHLQETKVIP
jgi:hypothetical protein